MEPALVIALSSDDVWQPEDSMDVRFLPLSPSASLEAARLGVKIVNPPWGRSYERQRELQDQVTCWMSQLKDTSDEASASIDEYGLTLLISNVILWRQLIRFALAVLGPGEVWSSIGSQPPPRTGPSMTLDEERDWSLTTLRWAVVAEETAGAPLATLSPRTANTEAELRISWSSRYARVLQSLVRMVKQGVGAARRTLTRPAHLIWRSSRYLVSSGAAPSNSCRAILIAQQSKVTELVARQRSSIGWEEVHYDELHTLCERGQYGSCDTTPVDFSSDGLVVRYAEISVLKVQMARGTLRALADGPNCALVTDAQHDPYVRALVGEFLAAGKGVALVPEGCVTYSGALEPFGEALYISGADVTRFVIDQKQQAYWSSRSGWQKQVIVSGYLGNTRQLATLAAKVTRSVQRLRLTRRLAACQGPVVTLTFDAFLGSVEVGRFGDVSQSDRLRDLVGVVECLDDAGVTVIAKLRDPDLTRQLRELFRGRRAILLRDTAWQTCVSVSDALVTRDSSIGWEAAKSGIPVVVWNFSDYPSFVEEALDGTEASSVVVARSLEELESVVRSLHPAQGGARGHGGSRLIARPTAQPEVVYQWLRRKCGRG